jgi:hypothetical protein
MKMRYALCLLPMAATLFGCASPVPVAQNFPASLQKVARTAHHWDVVANDVVDQTIAAINSTPILQNRALFVPRIVDASAFDASFRDFLITNMVNRNLPVNVCKSSALQKSGFMLESPEIQIEYEVRVIQHGARVPRYIPGLYTALGAGVSVLRNAAASDLTRGEENIGIIGFGALIDLARANVALPTDTELLLTTTIAEDNRFIMRRSDIYYVPNGDVKLFINSVVQKSTCSDEMVALADNNAQVKANAEAANARTEESRAQMVIRNMRRINPDWGRRY